ncbi:MAG TPA: hypothetical protein VE987_06370, partial [Polyangiaceae bacterium]|nr:hypothetical protein [Polyangiaceae bacterium]
MVAISLGPGRAEAAETLRLSVDWAKLSDLLHDGASLLRRESWEARARAAEALPGVAHDPPSFGVAPHVSLIARDWGGAQLLLGHLTAVDEARPSRSSRMLVTRVRFADGRAG